MAHKDFKSLMQAHFAYLEKNLNVKSISSDLFSDEVINLEVMEEIDASPSTKAANKVFLLHIIKTGTMEVLKSIFKLMENTLSECPKHMDVLRHIQANLLPEHPLQSSLGLRFQEPNEAIASNMQSYDLHDSYSCGLHGHLERKDAKAILKMLYLSTYQQILQVIKSYLPQIKSSIGLLFDNNLIEDDIKHKEVEAKQSVDELCKYLRIHTSWDNTSCLNNMLNSLDSKSQAYVQFKSILLHYEAHLHDYRLVISTKKKLESLRANNSQIASFDAVAVNITVTDSINELTCKGCMDLWRDILVEGAGIPRESIHWGSARSTRSTTITFYIKKIYIKFLTDWIFKPRSFWVMLHLRVIRIEIPGVIQADINWKNASQYIKDALLTGIHLKVSENLSLSYNALIDIPFVHPKEVSNQSVLQAIHFLHTKKEYGHGSSILVRQPIKCQTDTANEANKYVGRNMSLEPTTVQVLLLDKADSSIRKWLLQLQHSSNPGATIIQMYNCTLDAIKKTLRVIDGKKLESIISILGSEMVAKRWQDCNLLSQILKQVDQILEPLLLNEIHLSMCRYQKCLNAFFSWKNSLLKHTNSSFFPLKTQSDWLLDDSILKITCNFTVTLTGFKEIESLLGTEFCIDYESLHFNHASNTTLTWSISSGEAVKIVNQCPNQFWMLFENGIISIQIDDYFKLSLQGDSIKAFIRNSLQEQNRLLCFKAPSKQLISLVDPGLLEDYENSTYSLWKKESADPFFKVGKPLEVPRNKKIELESSQVMEISAIPKMALSPAPARVTTLSPATARVTTLSPATARVTTLSPATARITTLSPATARITTLSPATARVTTLSPATARVTTLSPATARVTTLSPATARVTTLSPATARVTTLSPATARVTTLSPATARVTTLSPATARVTTLSPATARVTTLSSVPARVTTLSPATARVTTLSPATARVTTLSPATARVTTLSPATARVTTLSPAARVTSMSVANTINGTPTLPISAPLSVPEIEPPLFTAPEMGTPFSITSQIVSPFLSALPEAHSILTTQEMPLPEVTPTLAICSNSGFQKMDDENLALSDTAFPETDSISEIMDFDQSYSNMQLQLQEPDVDEIELNFPSDPDSFIYNDADVPGKDLDDSFDIENLGIVCSQCFQKLSMNYLWNNNERCSNGKHLSGVVIKWNNAYFPARMKPAVQMLSTLCVHPNCPDGSLCNFPHTLVEYHFWSGKYREEIRPYCIDCRWIGLKELFKKRCLEGNHFLEKIVCIDYINKDLVTIRIPKAEDTQVMAMHSVLDCTSASFCTSPHSKEEEELWDLWIRSGMLSANCKPVALLRKTKAVLSYKDSRLSYKKEIKESNIPKVTLTRENYREMFLKMIDLEEEEHCSRLTKNNKSYKFTKYEYENKPSNHDWFGYLEMQPAAGDFVRQAASAVILEFEKLGTCRGNIFSMPVPHGDKETTKVLIGFNRWYAVSKSLQQTLTVKAKFILKISYFQSLRKSIEKLPEIALKKLLPGEKEASVKRGNIRLNQKQFPDNLKPDEEYQLPALEKLFSNPCTLPFLITGPFGTGKTRLLASAAYHILQFYQKARVLIITHHRQTADEYIQRLEENKLFGLKEDAIIRLISSFNIITSHKRKFEAFVNDFQIGTESLNKCRLMITTFLTFLKLATTVAMQPGHFKYVLIDEGAQTREPENVAAFLLAAEETKFVIAGDHMQVGPRTTVLGDTPRKMGLSISLLERLMETYKGKKSFESAKAVLLTNYRSHPGVLRLPSSLFYDNTLEAKSKALLHPTLKQPLHFIASSLDEVPVCSWHADKIFMMEAWKELHIVIQLVKFCRNQWPTIEWGRHNDSSLCVIFPTKLQKKMWQQLVFKRFPELKNVTIVPAYDIQGREYKAIFICTSGPVDKNFQEIDVTKSLCDPAVFDTVITRSSSLIVAVGNPFRLMEIEKRKIEGNQLKRCWLAYLHRCWETKSVVLADPVNKKRNSDKLREITLKLEEDIFDTIDLKEKLIQHRDNFKVIDDEDSILAGYNEALKDKNIKLGLDELGNDRGWSVSSPIPKGESERKEDSQDGFLCYLEQVALNHCLAFPVEAKRCENKGPKRVFIQNTYDIYGVSNRRGAFDGALVKVAERTSSKLGRRFYVSDVENQGELLPQICTADIKNGNWLIPVDGKSPRIVNLPHIAEYLLENRGGGGMQSNPDNLKKYLQKPRKDVVCFDINSLGSNQVPKIINTLLLEFAKDLLFVVKPFYWPREENFPVGAVVGILPRGTSLKRARYILNIQYMVPNKEAAFDMVHVDPAPKSFQTSGIAIRSKEGYSSCGFSLTKKDGFNRVQIHITNAASAITCSEDLDKFDLWTSFRVISSKTLTNEKIYYPVLPVEVVKKLSFSKKCNSRVITFSASFSENDKILPESTNFMESNFQCQEQLSMIEVENILDNSNTRKHKDSTSVADMLRKLYLMAKNLKQQRVEDKIYDTTTITTTVHQKAFLIFQEFLLLANSEAAKKIALSSPRQVLLKIERPPKKAVLNKVKYLFPNLTVLPQFSWLHCEPEHITDNMGGLLIDTQILQQLLKCLRNQNFRDAKNTLLSTKHFAEVGAFFNILHRESFDEEYVTVKLANIKHETEASEKKILESLKRLHPCHHRLQSTLTSFTSPFESVFDILVQKFLLKTIYNKVEHGALDRSLRLKKFCHNCKNANQRSKKYEEDLSLVELACKVQESSVATKAMIYLVRSGENASIEISFAIKKYYDIPVEKIKHYEIGQNVSPELWHCAKVTSIRGACRVLTDMQFMAKGQKVKAGKKDMSVAVFAPDEHDTLHKLEWPITYFCSTTNISADTWKQAVAFSTSESNEGAVSLEKQLSDVLSTRPGHKPRLPISSKWSEIQDELPSRKYTSELGQDGHLLKDPKDFQQAPLIMLRSKIFLQSPSNVTVWITADPTGYILTPKVQLVELTPNLRLCLQHHLNPEVSFTSGVTSLEAKDKWSLIGEYHSFWQDVVLSEAAASSIRKTELAPDSKDNKFLCLTDVLLEFEEFQIPRACLSEEIYEPVGDITTVLPREFVLTKQEFFPFEKGTLICARYEIQVSEREEPTVYKKYKKLLETHDIDGYARAVFHMVVKNVQTIRRRSKSEDGVDSDESDSLDELLPEDPIPYRVNEDLKVSFMILGEHNARISPLMKDLLSSKKNKYTCEIQLIPLNLPVKRVYQSLKRMEKDNRNPLDLANSIALGKLENLKDLNSIQQRNRRRDITQFKNNYTFHEMMWDTPRSCFLSLSKDQHQALYLALQNKFLVIQGPPGCGKSLTGAHIAYAFSLLNRQNVIKTSSKTTACRCVLYCAPTNDAVDAVAEMLLSFRKEKLRLLRIYSRGIERRIYPGPSAYKHVFEDVVSGKEPKKNLEDISLHCIIRNQFSKNASKLKKLDEEFIKCEERNEVPSGQRRLLYHKLVYATEADCVREGEFDIVLCTCNEAAGDRVRKYFKPEQCIIDEASRCTEPETMAPISISQQVVLLGDHKQLGPTVHSKKVEDKLKRSLFERYATLLTADYRSMFFQLQTQYRMREGICRFASKWFYGGNLKSDSKKIAHVPSALYSKLLKDSKAGFLFHRIEGNCVESHKSYSNEEEAEFIVKQMGGIQKQLKQQSSTRCQQNVGILTFYQEQKQLIEKKLKCLDLPTNTYKVKTVDSSQGTEFDYVIISTVRSVPSEELQKIKVDLSWRRENIGIVDNENHVCVALTRARSGVVVVGNENILRCNRIWKDYLQYCL